MCNQSDEEIKKEFYEKISKKIKITENGITEDRNWINYFLMIKRWYYRLRDSDFCFENNHSIGSLKIEEDHLWAFFVLCYHLKDWLILCGVVGKKEIEDYINKNEALSLCADACNSSKHSQLDKNKKCWTKDLETRIINPSIEIEYKNQKKYVPITFVFSNGKNIDAYKLVNDCMQAWGEFIISKNLEIPEFEEENTKAGFVKWEIKK